MYDINKAIGIFDFIKQELISHKPFSKEKFFTTRMLGLFRSRKAHAHKISDASPEKKPYDCVITYKGYSCHIEVKSIKNKTKVEVIGLLRDNQYQGLKEVSDNGGIALIVIYNKVLNRIDVLEFKPVDSLILNYSDGL